MENLSQAKKQIANLLASTISNNFSSQHYSQKCQAIKMQKDNNCEIHIRQHRRRQPTVLTVKT